MYWKVQGRVHEYGNICPCDQCGYQGPDIVKLKNHTEEEHEKSYYNGRIKQIYIT